MAEYAAHITTDVGEVTDDQLDDLVDALAPVAGVPSMLGGRLSVQLTVEADALLYAHTVAYGDVLAACSEAGLADVEIVGVEVLTAAEFERQQDGPPPVDDLVSTVQAGRILGVSRQRILQLSANHSNFPEPVNLGTRGLYWSAAALRRFDATWDRSFAPKRHAG